MEKKTFFTVRNLALIGVLAAIVFVLTKFISIPIPRPLGKTALSVFNAMFVLSDLLFGPAVGGLAARIRQRPGGPDRPRLGAGVLDHLY